MKLKDILSPSFKDYQLSIGPMVVVEYDTDLCQEVVSNGWLSEEQMRHAADRYRLGKGRSGKTIYWMMDEMGVVRDGHLADSWVSSILKAREPNLLRSWHPSHCFFGQHLLCHTEITETTDLNSCHSCNSLFESVALRTCSTKKESVSSVQSVVGNKLISVVESEASAVILSELFPESIWLAYVYPANLTVDLFASLQGRSVTIYPQTDPCMDTYLSFLDLADSVRRRYPSIDISIDRILEDNATDEQKERNIDLVDFLFEQ